MTSSIAAADVARHLTARRHTNFTTGPSWRPGFRATQASPRTVRIWHDGPDEAEHLDQYAQLLHAAGYTVISERAKTKRPALRITHP
ncbi:hypothetical protein [Streptomyces rugosispiralis]|uniref:Uncharacterized protein n=1 Tax=Streptomyces rugosispiralis TaxID=2967341 RepID=A0ABT1UYH4_9ACTN|nr:hypothetical protein [Streptomyces rugosispiralis]MCQ8190174.1 hypothetical protein [Streptomyces rugosispiralis]